MQAIVLGKKYRDVVTGIEGIATSITTYLNGCVRVAIQPQFIKDGKSVDCEFIDVDQVELIGDGILAKAAKPKDTGGPQDRHKL